MRLLPAAIKKSEWVWCSSGPGFIWAAWGQGNSSTPGEGVQEHLPCCVLQAGVQASGGGINVGGGTWSAIHPGPLNLPHRSEGLFWQEGLGKHV